MRPSSRNATRPDRWRMAYGVWRNAWPWPGRRHRTSDRRDQATSHARLRRWLAFARVGPVVGARQIVRVSLPPSRRARRHASAPRPRAATSSTHGTGRSRASCAPSRTPINRLIGTLADQTLEAAISVHLQHSIETHEVFGGAGILAVLAYTQPRKTDNVHCRRPDFRYLGPVNMRKESS
jgi:hypothetical protein